MAVAAPRIESRDGCPVLLVDDVIQSVGPVAALTFGSYWAAMVPPVRPARVLLLGLGGATLAHLLVARWGDGISIVGVDDDAAVLAAAADAGWLDLPGLQPICADALDYVRETSGPFDFVGVDLYRGGFMPRQVLGRAFLRRVRALLAPRGTVSLNLYGLASAPRRVRVFADVFEVVHRVPSGDNVVLHGRARAQPAIASS
jgi:spermidine synthase